MNVCADVCLDGKVSFVKSARQSKHCSKLVLSGSREKKRRTSFGSAQITYLVP